MSEILIKVINLSLSASWLILAVILLRAIFKKAPKWFPCALWAIVAIRLIVPFSFESVTSVLPSSEPIPSEIVTMEKPQVNSGITYINDMINPVIEKVIASPVEKRTVVNTGAKVAHDNGIDAVDAASAERPANDAAVAGQAAEDTAKSGITMQSIVKIAMIVWVSGMVVILGYSLVGAWRLKRRIAASILIEEGVLACDEVKSPFIFGIFRPMIYVPSSMNAKTLSYVLAHERAHLARKDHLWKPLGFALLAVYWFNPLSWVAYILLCRDIEMACDEKVVRDMEKNRAAEYSQALLDCSVRKLSVAACPLAFGEIGVKQRVKNVLGYKKPKYVLVALLIAACGVVSGCFLTSPKKENVNAGQQAAAHTDGTASAASLAKYDFDGYSVELKNASFDGSEVSVDYEVTRDEKIDLYTFATRFSISGEGRGKLAGNDLVSLFLCSSELLEKKDSTCLYRMTGHTQEPIQSVELNFSDLVDNSKHTYTLTLNDDAKVSVITPDMIDTSDWGKHGLYVTNPNMKGMDDRINIDRIILSDSCCVFCLNSTFDDAYLGEIGELQVAYTDSDFQQISGKYENTRLSYATFLGKEDQPGPYMMLIVFDIPDGETQESMLEKLQNAKFKL